MSCNIVFIGAGNLATHLAIALKSKGYKIVQVYSRTERSAEELAGKVDAQYTTAPEGIMENADIYFVALKDDAFEEVLQYPEFGDSLLVHCSGSMPLSALGKFAENTGVFYPLQTFSKNHEVNFSNIPCFVEAKSKNTEKLLIEIGENISGNVSVLNSEKRLFLHIAAVFACNFVNYFYTAASDILKSRNLSFEALRPLILETALKVQRLYPEQAQTGPAVRFDRKIINRHTESLRDFPELQDLYYSLSRQIFLYHNSHEDEGVMNDFKNVKAFIFDVDGVLSKEISSLDKNGDPVRTANFKDGFAIKNAVDMGYPVAVITGGSQQRVKLRYRRLGVTHYYDGAADKKACLSDFLLKTGIDAGNVLYMGDDIVDYGIMCVVGIPASPCDAATEIKQISKYISPKKGGEGCVRDVIEKTLRARGKWHTSGLSSINSI
jgi:YrbI family 3-deoxy-D-manno-octulosonate 8-phosphate phosphatase